MSEAVVAPDCSITSGATSMERCSVRTGYEKGKLTPIGTANNSIVGNSTSCGRTSDPKVSKLYTTILVSQDVRALDIPMDDTLIM